MSYIDLSQRIFMCKNCRTLFGRRRYASAYCPVCLDARRRTHGFQAKSQGDS